MANYKELLLDPRWQKKRLDILNRDEWRCKACGETKKTLHVHHFKYQSGKLPWEYPDTNFITLCCDCHEEEELFIKNQHTGFIKLNRFVDFPIRKMWHISLIICFLYRDQREDYKVLVEIINDLLDKHEEGYNNFYNEYE